MKPLFAIEKKTGRYFFFGSVPALLAQYPTLVRSTVEYYLSRKKKPYDDDELTVYKGDLIRAERL
jgi:hypothetical protein